MTLTVQHTDGSSRKINLAPQFYIGDKGENLSQSELDRKARELAHAVAGNALKSFSLN